MSENRGHLKTPKLNQLVFFLALLPFYGVAVWVYTSFSEGGTLVCSRAANRCEIANGWLIRHREQFPADDLIEAKIVPSRLPTGFGSVKSSGVTLITRSGPRSLGGKAAGSADVVTAINAFARDPGSASLDVHVAASAVAYGVAWFLGVVYSLVVLSGLVSWLRGRGHPAPAAPMKP